MVRYKDYGIKARHWLLVVAQASRSFMPMKNNMSKFAARDLLVFPSWIMCKWRGAIPVGSP